VSGALPGRVYLAKLTESGFHSAQILEKTGYTTSKYTEAYYVTAARSLD